jgi:hypothetical protein
MHAHAHQFNAGGATWQPLAEVLVVQWLGKYDPAAMAGNQ